MIVTRAAKPEKQALKVKVEGGRLTISIGVETLAYAARQSPQFDGGRLTVSDVGGFASAVAKVLEIDDEVGTPVQKMLDEAFNEVVEFNFPGCQYEEAA